MIGKPGSPVTRISQAYPDRVEVRGRDLTELMGRLSFTQYFHLLLTGHEPTEEQAYFLDVLLVAIAEHGMMPTNVAARMTLAADPDSLQGAVAAGILGAGPRPARDRGAVRADARRCAGPGARGRRSGGGGRRDRARDPRRRRQAARDSGTRCTSRSTRAPSGSSSSPTSGRSAGRTSRSPELCARASAEVWGKPLTMNVSLPIAAVMLDLGFPPSAVKSVPILARTAGLLAHLAEEREHPLGFLMAGAAEDAVEYEAG